MTYKKIYSMLNKRGSIDKAIAMFPNELNDTKMVIIDVLEYIEYFIKSSSFSNMEYWYDGRHNTPKKERIYKYLVNEFIEIVKEQNNKKIEKFNYWQGTIKEAE